MLFLQRCALLIAVALLAGCTRFDALNAVVPSWGATRTADLRYGSLPRQDLDVYMPAGGQGAADVVIFFYGGDWQYGEKKDYRFVAEGLAGRGFVAVIPDYRLYPEVRFPAFVQDGALAVRWVHENIARYGGNPRRVFLMGHSAGGTSPCCSRSTPITCKTSDSIRLQSLPPSACPGLTISSRRRATAPFLA